MTTHYILFIHGVNTSDRNYAEDLIKGIQSKSPHVNVDPISLYWGDVNESALGHLLEEGLEKSSLWKKMWFRDFREQHILGFVGDAALYISSHIGYKIVQKLKESALQQLQDAKPDDCLHLVTHSWGTVILFDILFANRWDDPEVRGHNEVMEIRDYIFGLSGKNDSTDRGIKLASIHTLGSPIALFSLTRVNSDPTQLNSDASSHDITLSLQKLLRNLSQARQQEKLLWKNFIHPGDPIAYPLEELMKDLVDNDEQYIDFQDIIAQKSNLLNFLKQLISQTTLALLQGGKAHESYWKSQKVIQEITSILNQTAFK
ncbi:MAG: hypothetical protein QNJ49_06685 [Mastigocoleus sp. MO_167.B18]|nr:hypothetical protein [Mastigocoleus sp. MO_167.B18]